MNYKTIYNIALFFGIVTFTCACESLQKYPDEPQISFTSLTITEDNGSFNTVLEFNLIDGDGDIGVYQPISEDSTAIDTLIYYNFFSNFFHKENGIYEKIVFKELEYNFRMPYIEKEGQDKSIDADVFIEMALYPKTFNVGDTLRLDFYVLDRATNKSNVETVTDFVLKEGVISSKTPE